MKKYRTDEEWKAILLEYEQSTGQVKETLEKYGIVGGMLRNALKRYGAKHPRGDPRNIAVLKGAAPKATGASKTGRKQHSDEMKQKAIELRATGMTYAAISKELRIGNPALVYSWLNNAKRKAIPTPGAAGGADVSAAINLLRKMKKEVTRLIRAGKLESADYAHQLGLMALRMLAGDDD